jgi:hypothetical protein
MASAPKSVTIRTCQVGFGDCFLVSFSYGPKSEKHILVDFGSTGFPKRVPKSRMMDIAHDIKERTNGSRYATPKSLWKLFKNKSERKTSNRLLSLMSTMEGKHGDVHSHTEVPRETLVHELQRNSDLFTTQQLQGKQFFHDTVVTF